MNIRRGPDAWYVKLSPADTALMGTAWVPLPLTAKAPEEQVVAFCRINLGATLYDGSVTVEAPER